MNLLFHLVGRVLCVFGWHAWEQPPARLLPERCMDCGDLRTQIWEREPR